MEPARLPLPYTLRPPKNSLPQPPLLVMLHDQGGNEHDLLKLVLDFDDRFLIACPGAPHPSIKTASPDSDHTASIDAGTNPSSWLPLEPVGSSPENQPPKTSQIGRVVVRFIDAAVRAYHCDPSRIYLAGIGQGAVLALSVIATEPELLAGAAVSGGEVPAEFHTLPVPSDRLKRFPVFAAYALDDPVYPAEAGRAVQDILSALLADVTCREHPDSSPQSRAILSDMRNWLSVQLNSQGSGLAAPSPTPEVPPLRLGHVTLKVRSLDRSVAFYTRLLGLQVTERAGSAIAFLSSGPASHHVLALEKTGDAAGRQDDTSAGLSHIAFEVQDQAAFARIYQALTAARLKLQTRDHGICWSLYFQDPDQNTIEIYWDARSTPGHASLWQGRDLPLQASRVLAVLPDTARSEGTT